MLLKVQDAKYFEKYLVSNGDGTYRAFNLDNIPLHDKEWLIDFDNRSLICDGIHGISNYNDLLNRP